ncbi:MAG: excinuclease ABC subunit UvrA [Mycoplasmataceae bacterium]|nr:excinuclease ABC subunit UvrA [Mycoplasmataceae bacterium]
MAKKNIEIRGAKENNLKNIDVDIPKDKLTVITGVSGSGKSSLAFGVLYNEGRRRYVDSLSNYARQFIGGTSKPDVESIEGLSPAIAIDQKTTSNNPRSTVGTITEIYDFYRLLFARVGTPFCPVHNIKITAQTITEILNSIYDKNNNKMIQVLSPKIIDALGPQPDLIKQLKEQGFVRILVNGKIKRLDEKINFSKTGTYTISIVVDRIKVDEDNRSRLFEAIQVATDYAEGIVEVENLDSKEIYKFSRNYSCPHGDFFIDKIEPRTFSFNSPHGACLKCKGLGTIEEVTWEKIANPNKTILEGGIGYFGEKMSGVDWQSFETLLSHYEIPLINKLSTFTQKQKDFILYGSNEPIHYVIKTEKASVRKFDRIEGIADKLWRRYESTSSKNARDYYKKFLGSKICDICNGLRLNKKALSVKINDLNITDLTKLSIADSKKWVDNIKLNKQESIIAGLVLSEIKSRFLFLINVGLHYLTLDRIAGTLSGGESQRIRLASQLGSRLTGVIYVLDEPSIGLHQRDNGKLIQTLKEIRDLGNTVVVVEHDEETMFESDYIIDIGPKAGEAGGEIVAFGTPDQVSKMKTLTGDFLSGIDYIEIPKKRRKGNGKFIQVNGAKENNLKNINVTIPLNTFTVVSGVSGSGKSTLVNEIIYKGIFNKITKTGDQKPTGKHDSLLGSQNVDKIIHITQDPIGRTPRSNPATYTGVFDEIRDIFALSPEAKIRGYAKGRFSFNVPGGRCDKCQGDGIIKIAMHFLPDVHVTCDQCDGKRYNEETLLIKYKEKTISDVLEMSVDLAYEFFINVPKIQHKLKFLKDVGLGYIKLGHSATLLSGGEAQRVKLALHLQKRPTGKTLYILDEPTTGLHHADIKLLLKVLDRIVSGGDSLIVIEHNIDVIKMADYIIDMGPDGGDDGGRIVSKGSPEVVSGSKDSATAPFLKNALNKFK